MNVIKTTLHYLFRLRAWALLFFAVALSGSALRGRNSKYLSLPVSRIPWACPRAHHCHPLQEWHDQRQGPCPNGLLKRYEQGFRRTFNQSRELDELSGGIGLPTIKKMPDGPEKEGIGNSSQQAGCRTRNLPEKMIDACTVSDRVYLLHCG